MKFPVFIVLIALILIIASLSVKIIIDETRTHEPFNIKTQADLTEIKQDLFEAMVESRIFLEVGDLFTLVSPDPESHMLLINPNIGENSGAGATSWPSGYAKERLYPNGTRTYQSFEYANYSLNDTVTYHPSSQDVLLKSIIINDEFEKTFLIISKGE